MQPNANKTFYRRKQFLIEKRLQHTIIWRFVMVVIVSILFSQLITVGFFKIKELINPSSQDLIYLSSTMHESMVFSQVVEILWLPMLISALLGCGLVLFFGLFFSHRIAGPIFNLKRMMRQVEGGNLKVTMRIRETDEFHDVEKSFNQMIAGLNLYMEKFEKAVSKLPESDQKEIKEIFREMNSEDPEKKI